MQMNVHPGQYSSGNECVLSSSCADDTDDDSSSYYIPPPDLRFKTEVPKVVCIDHRGSTGPARGPRRQKKKKKLGMHEM